MRFRPRRTRLLSRRHTLLEFVELLLHLVEVALEDLVGLFVRALLLAALDELGLELREGLGLLLDALEPLLQQLDLDRRLLVRFLLQTSACR